MDTIISIIIITIMLIFGFIGFKWLYTKVTGNPGRVDFSKLSKYWALFLLFLILFSFIYQYCHHN